MCAGTPASSKTSSFLNPSPQYNKEKATKIYLARELNAKIVPPNLFGVILAFCDKITTAAHEYTSEVCFSDRHSIMGLVNWSPNDVTEDVRPERDCRGLCSCLKGFQSVTLPDSEDLRPVGALLLKMF